MCCKSSSRGVPSGSLSVFRAFSGSPLCVFMRACLGCDRFEQKLGGSFDLLYPCSMLALRFPTL